MVFFIFAKPPILFPKCCCKKIRADNQISQSSSLLTVQRIATITLYSTKDSLCHSLSKQSDSTENSSYQENSSHVEDQMLKRLETISEEENESISPKKSDSIELPFSIKCREKLTTIRKEENDSQSRSISPRSPKKHQSI